MASTRTVGDHPHGVLSTSTPAGSPRVSYIWTYMLTDTPKKDDIVIAAVTTDRTINTSIISSDHARRLSFGTLESSCQNSGVGNQDIDVTIDVRWAGKGGDGGFLRCRLSDDIEHDLHLGSDFLSGYSSALYNERPRKPPSEIKKSLDASFQIVPPDKHKKFFKRGKVIRVGWPQPQSADSLNRNEKFRVEGWTETIHYKIAWFVVIQVFKTHCIGLPVHTYQGRGTTKPGVDASVHAALVLEGSEQKLLEGESLENEPIHMIAGSSIKYDEASRIDFSKPSTLEYNIKVMGVGRVIPRDIKLLMNYFLCALSKVGPEKQGKVLLGSIKRNLSPGTDETDRGETDRGETDRGETDRGETDRGETDGGDTIERQLAPNQASIPRNSEESMVVKRHASMIPASKRLRTTQSLNLSRGPWQRDNDVGQDPFYQHIETGERRKQSGPKPTSWSRSPDDESNRHGRLR